jgi:hypothetical protein
MTYSHFSAGGETNLLAVFSAINDMGKKVKS